VTVTAWLNALPDNDEAIASPREDVSVYPPTA
jgi:hypothetical protein